MPVHSRIHVLNCIYLFLTHCLTVHSLIYVRIVFLFNHSVTYSLKHCLTIDSSIDSVIHVFIISS